MHELGLARSILDLVERSVPAARRGDVRRVRVRAGALAGVLVESLRFCFDALAPATELRAATLEVERVPATLRCARCRVESSVATLVARCPACGADDLELVHGRELDVVDVELDERKEAVA